jgi:hypothetical protein
MRVCPSRSLRQDSTSPRTTRIFSEYRSTGAYRAPTITCLKNVCFSRSEAAHSASVRFDVTVLRHNCFLRFINPCGFNNQLVVCLKFVTNSRAEKRYARSKASRWKYKLKIYWREASLCAFSFAKLTQFNKN